MDSRRNSIRSSNDIRSFASGYQPFPISKIAGKTQLVSALPACAYKHRMTLAALRVLQIAVGAACAVDMRCKRIAVGLHVRDERIHLSDGLAEIREG